MWLIIISMLHFLYLLINKRTHMKRQFFFSIIVLRVVKKFLIQNGINVNNSHFNYQRAWKESFLMHYTYMFLHLICFYTLYLSHTQKARRINLWLRFSERKLYSLAKKDRSLLSSNRKNEDSEAQLQISNMSSLIYGRM